MRHDRGCLDVLGNTSGMLRRGGIVSFLACLLCLVCPLFRLVIVGVSVSAPAIFMLKTMKITPHGTYLLQEATYFPKDVEQGTKVAVSAHW